ELDPDADPGLLGTSQILEADMLDRLGELWREALYGLRLLRKHPGYTLIVSTTLALGIGATTALFSVLYTTVLAPLPFVYSERLVWIQQVNAPGQGGG